MRSIFQKNNKKGFTLVELMVSVAVFSIVMVVAAGALLSVIDANRKAQAIKTAVNNINFAVESISKDMRMGTEYSCFVETSFIGDCSSGGTGVRYKSYSGKYTYYLFNRGEDGVPGGISKCVSDSDSGCFTYQPITSHDVDITDMTFYVIGSDDFGAASNRTQPRVIITLNGEAGGSKETVKTTFDLQTSVSQRARYGI